MENQNIGPSIKTSFEFLEKIFSDTSKFLTVIEEYVKKYNLIAAWGSTSVWDRSSAYYGFYGWLPHYLCRVYMHKDPSGKKPNTEEKFFLFVNIYFTPENITQPIVLFGVTELKEDDFFNSWDSLMLSTSGPNFVNSDHISEWEIFNDNKIDSSINMIHYKVKPLVEFTDQAKTESICLELINKLNEIKGKSN